MNGFEIEINPLFYLALTFDVFEKGDIIEMIRNVEINEQAYEIQLQGLFVL
jgi:hypothetical protein